MAKEAEKSNGLVTTEMPPLPTQEMAIPRIKIEGIAPAKANSFLSDEVIKAIALASQATGQSPDAIVAKVLEDAFTSEGYPVIKLYRLLARRENQRSLNQDLALIKQREQEIHRELAALEAERQRLEQA